MEHRVYNPFDCVFARRWMALFVATPTVCTIIWDKLDPYNTMPKGVCLRHWLWALYFMKVYPVVSVGRGAVAGEKNLGFASPVDEKTWREWTKIFVEAISYLESTVVSLLSPLVCLFFFFILVMMNVIECHVANRMVRLANIWPNFCSRALWQLWGSTQAHMKALNETSQNLQGCRLDFR